MFENGMKFCAECLEITNGIKFIFKDYFTSSVNLCLGIINMMIKHFFIEVGRYYFMARNGEQSSHF